MSTDKVEGEEKMGDQSAHAEREVSSTGRDLRQINELDAALYVDTVCYGCKRQIALSNTVERDGRRYCYRC